jgi:hypothetical protein
VRANACMPFGFVPVVVLGSADMIAMSVLSISVVSSPADTGTFDPYRTYFHVLA